MLILEVLRNENVPAGNGPMWNAREQDVSNDDVEWFWGENWEPWVTTFFE